MAWICERRCAQPEKLHNSQSKFLVVKTVVKSGLNGKCGNKTLTDSVAGDGHSRTTTISDLRFHLMSISIVFEW